MKTLLNSALVAAWCGLFAILGAQATVTVPTFHGLTASYSATMTPQRWKALDLDTRMTLTRVRLSSNIEDDRAHTWKACGTHNGRYFCTEYDGIPPRN